MTAKAKAKPKVLEPVLVEAIGSSVHLSDGSRLLVGQSTYVAADEAVALIESELVRLL